MAVVKSRITSSKDEVVLGIRNELIQLNDDLGSMKVDIGMVAMETGGLKNDLGGMAAEIGLIKSRVEGLATSLEGLSEAMKEIENRVMGEMGEMKKGIETILEMMLVKKTTNGGNRSVSDSKLIYEYMEKSTESKFEVEIELFDSTASQKQFLSWIRSVPMSSLEYFEIKRSSSTWEVKFDLPHEDSWFRNPSSLGISNIQQQKEMEQFEGEGYLVSFGKRFSDVEATLSFHQKANKFQIGNEFDNVIVGRIGNPEIFDSMMLQSRSSMARGQSCLLGNDVSPLKWI